MVLERLVGQDLLAPKLGWYQLGVDMVSVLPGDVSPDRVVPGEGPVTVGTRHSDALVSLSYVSPQVCLVSVGSLAKWAFEFCSYSNIVISVQVVSRCVCVCSYLFLKWHLHWMRGQGLVELSWRDQRRGCRGEQ